MNNLKQSNRRSFRPPDWERIRRDNNIYPEAAIPSHHFEAGASAILEALKKQGHKAYNNIPLATFGSPDLSRPAGWLVFIEEVDDGVA